MSETQTRTRAEIQAEIEKLQAEMEAAPENHWKVGDRVACVGVIEELRSSWAIVQNDKNIGDLFVDYPALIPAADLIPREEHERLLANARIFTTTQDAIKCLVKSHDDEFLSGEVSFPYSTDDGVRYRVTVERVDADHIVDANKMVAPEPVGYANLFSDGKTWSGVYNTPDGAERATGNVKCTETAVPLYRRPFDPVKTLPAGCRDGVDYVVREYVLDDCDRGAQPRYIREWEGEYYTVTVQRREAEEPLGPVAVGPQGVVELLKEAFRAYGKAKAKSYDHSAIATAERLFQSHISKITELPEPGGEVRIDRTPANYDVATIILRSGFMLKFDQAEDALQLAADSVKAAALLAKEADRE